ncbi:hypothetical protein CDAR_386141 [Caerostris darwini]|uniref:Uncharacterized protein n=1 Tax=Caerostris darwini TaxID=1538125 RepID=A0AAV4SH26_9ARAC|nr:hypothetical protein CDAR_386141 [Caerostris darwini]
MNYANGIRKDGDLYRGRRDRFPQRIFQFCSSFSRQKLEPAILRKFHRSLISRFSTIHLFILSQKNYEQNAHQLFYYGKRRLEFACGYIGFSWIM